MSHAKTVFLFDVDNTLLDHDRVTADLRRHLESEVGPERGRHYWEIFESIRAELGYADYLGALQTYRLKYPHDSHLLAVSYFLMEYPFAERLFPHALEVIARAKEFGPAAILTDGDVVFQPLKIYRSGLFDAFGGNVLIYVHKEQELSDVEQRYPAEHYVVVDDKLRILAAIKKIWKSRVTTVFVRQGHYASDTREIAKYSPADVTLNRIGEFLEFDLHNRLAAGSLESCSRLNDSRAEIDTREGWPMVAGKDKVEIGNFVSKQRHDLPLALAVAALCIVVLGAALFFTQLDDIRAGASDFRSHYTGAVMLRSGHAAHLYDYALQAQVQNQLFPGVSQPGVALPYNHPPFELLLFLPLTLFSYLPAYFVWLGITLLLALTSARLFSAELPRLREIWIAFPEAIVLCLFPFLICVLHGQDSVLALLVIAAAWRCFVRGADAAAGIFLALGLFKFQIFVPLAVLLSVARPRILRGFAPSAAALVVISWLMVGTTGMISYPQFLLEMAQQSSVGGEGQKYGMITEAMPNLRGLAYGVSRLGLHAAQSPALVMLAILLCMALVVWQIRRARKDSREALDAIFALSVTASLVLSFHLQLHDLTLLALPIAIGISRLASSRSPWRGGDFALAAVILVFYTMPLHLLLMHFSLLYLLAVPLLAFGYLLAHAIPGSPSTESLGQS